MKKIYPILFAIAIFTSCGKSNSSEQAEETAATSEDELYQKVMAVHDEVMPKMNDIYKLKKQLKEEIESSPDLVEERKQEIENRIKQLDEASEGMMQWMRNFSPEDYKENKEDYLDYLNKEFEKVNKVKADMLNALEDK